MTNLVAESGKLFGTRHYRDYHFLLTLSDHVAHFGLEHHESNDSRLPERALISPGAGMSLGGLLAHEFVHSWNGKFRRPADLAVPYYEQPMETDLLWGYEGLTDYLGPMLAARSGLWTPERVSRVPGQHRRLAGPRTTRPHLASAARHRHRRARRLGFGAAAGSTGAAAPTTTTKATCSGLKWPPSSIANRKGEKSIDDFCHAFHGGPNNGPEVKTYTFDQLVAALNAIAPYDWATFLHNRLDSTVARSSHRRHRERRLEGGLQRRSHPNWADAAATRQTSTPSACNSAKTAASATPSSADRPSRQASSPA